MLKPLSRYKKEIDIVNSKSAIPNTFYYMLTDVLSLNLKDALFEIKKCDIDFFTTTERDYRPFIEEMLGSYNKDYTYLVLLVCDGNLKVAWVHPLSGYLSVAKNNLSRSSFTHIAKSSGGDKDSFAYLIGTNAKRYTNIDKSDIIDCYCGNIRFNDVLQHRLKNTTFNMVAKKECKGVDFCVATYLRNKYLLDKSGYSRKYFRDELINRFMEYLKKYVAPLSNSEFTELINSKLIDIKKYINDNVNATFFLEQSTIRDDIANCLESIDSNIDRYTRNEWMNKAGIYLNIRKNIHRIYRLIGHYQRLLKR